MKTLNNLKTKVLLFLLLVAAGLAKAQTQLVEGWMEISTGVSESLFGVYCINENEVVVCGENGKILKTSDGGASWEVNFEKEGFNMVHVAFADEQVGYACGNPVASCQCIIVKTTDGGQTWQELPYNIYACLENEGWYRSSHLFVVNSETFFLADFENETLWNTFDGGQSFNHFDLSSGDIELPLYLNNVSCCELFFEDETGYLVILDQWNEQLYVCKTTDLGATWIARHSVVSDHPSFVAHFFDKNHIEIYGSFNGWSHNMIVTEDGFESVSFENSEALPDMGTSSYAKFTSDTYGCIFGGNTLTKGSTIWGSVIMKNGWENWISANQGLPGCEYQGTTQCQDIYNLDGADTTFYIVSENGLVYKSAMISITNLPESVSGITVCPNPAKEKIAIDGAQAAETQVYNALGQLVKTVQNTNEINLHGLPQGIYLLRVALEDGTVFTDKVVKE